MPEPTPAVMQVPSAALPALIAAHEQALRDLRPMLNTLIKSGRISDAWTRDPVAEDITMRFNSYAVDGDGSAYQCLRLYQQELQRITDTLRQMHADYQAGEDAAATTMRLT